MAVTVRPERVRALEEIVSCYEVGGAQNEYAAPARRSA